MKRLFATAGLAIAATIGVGQTAAQAGYVFIVILGNGVVDHERHDHEGRASNMIVVEPTGEGGNPGMQENTLRGTTPDDGGPIIHDLNVYMGIDPEPF